MSVIKCVIYNQLYLMRRLTSPSITGENCVSGNCESTKQKTLYHVNKIYGFHAKNGG